MKKLIFRRFSLDITGFFLLAIISIGLIVWIIQAVNYLDFVSEDGHSFKVYFMYSLLSLPKIFNKLILFVFFISVFFTLSKYEENNEILIFWTHGIKKTEFINKLIKFSFIYFLISLVLSVFIVPKTQDMGRSFIRDSNIDYLPSIIKTQHFNDAVNDLTIFIEEKSSDGFIKNIFIKESYEDEKSQIINAKKGLLIKKNNSYFLILLNGKIINIDKRNTNIITFEKSEFNLSRYTTKTTIFPKIQETNTVKLIECLNSFINYKSGFFEELFVCDKNSINPVVQEIFKRTISPLYIIISAFIAGCLILSSKSTYNFSRFKIFIFLIGFIFIIFSEGLVNYLVFDNLYKSLIVLIPFIIITIIYLIFISSKKIKLL